MKFNLKTFALASLSAVALIASPLVLGQSAHAQGDRRAEVLEQLDLTASQSEQLAAIREDTKAQMQAVLTSEQQATLENSETHGRHAFRELDLSEAQRDQLRAIREDARAEVNAVLTPEQREQLETIRSEHEGRRGQRGFGPRSAR